jgi:DNA-binding MarR family transcriptional regulator
VDSLRPEVSDLPARVHVSVTRLTRRLRAQRADTAVTLTDLSAMATLHSCGPLTPGKLAEAERLQPSSVTRVLTRLQTRGLIRRQEDPTDKRQWIIVLTGAGLDHLLAELAVTERWLHRRLADLTDPDRDTLAQAVTIIDRMVGV